MRHKLQLAIMALVLAGVFSSAQAATINLNDTSFPFNLGPNPTDNNAFSVTHDPGSFSDEYRFSLTAVSDTISSAVGLLLPGFNGGAPSYQIKDAALALIHDVGNNGVGGGDDVSLATVAFGSSNATLAVLNVAAGSYFFQVSGNATGTQGGLYQFAVNTVATAVPEPETYALMLSGLGLLGLIGRRRMKKPSNLSVSNS